jgi:hypothetical protein
MTPMPANQNTDVKDIVMDGCRVHLAFSSKEGRWTVTGTVRCGLGENGGEQSFKTGTCASRDQAEQEALRTATGLLGQNVDRSTSRVRNWS